MATAVGLPSTTGVKAEGQDQPDLASKEVAYKMHGEVSITGRQSARGACVHVRAARGPITRG